MKTTDANDRPLSTDELLLSLNDRTQLLYAFALDLRKNPDAENGFKVFALANGVLAFLDDIERAADAARGRKLGKSTLRPEPFRTRLNDHFTPESVLRVLTEFSHGWHNPIGSEDWHTEFFENADLAAYKDDALQELRDSADKILAERRKAGAA